MTIYIETRLLFSDASLTTLILEFPCGNGRPLMTSKFLHFYCGASRLGDMKKKFDLDKTSEIFSRMYKIEFEEAKSSLCFFKQFAGVSFE